MSDREFFTRTVIGTNAARGSPVMSVSTGTFERSTGPVDVESGPDGEGSAGAAAG